jgi:hypothetical protein
MLEQHPDDDCPFSLQVLDMWGGKFTEQGTSSPLMVSSTRRRRCLCPAIVGDALAFLLKANNRRPPTLPHTYTHTH